MDNRRKPSLELENTWYWLKMEKNNAKIMGTAMAAVAVANVQMWNAV
jgi:hypothetical protein